MAPSQVAILAVDTACTIPMQTVKCSVTKAFIYRSATEKPRKERLEQMPYSDCGDISKVAPYAAQEDTAAGAEDHPDAQGCCFHACSDSYHHLAIDLMPPPILFLMAFGACTTVFLISPQM